MEKTKIFRIYMSSCRSFMGGDRTVGFVTSELDAKFKVKQLNGKETCGFMYFHYEIVDAIELNKTEKEFKKFIEGEIQETMELIKRKENDVVKETETIAKLKDQLTELTELVK